VTWEWRKLHNEELNDLHCSPDIVRVIKWRIVRSVWHVARMGERRGVYRVLVGKPEGKRPLGRPRCRWEANIKMDLQEVGCGGMDWIEVALDRDRGWALVSAVMKRSGDKIKNEMGRACRMYGERRGVYMVLVGKLDGKRSRGRHRRRWEITLRWIFRK